MALPSTVYKISIQLSDLDRGVYETLLAYAVLHEPELTAGQRRSSHLTDPVDNEYRRGEDQYRRCPHRGIVREPVEEVTYRRGKNYPVFNHAVLLQLPDMKILPYVKHFASSEKGRQA